MAGILFAHSVQDIGDRPKWVLNSSEEEEFFDQCGIRDSLIVLISRHLAATGPPSALYRFKRLSILRCVIISGDLCYPLSAFIYLLSDVNNILFLQARSLDSLRTEFEV
ncbi:unnamed protein product [Soboliphyme baturini]|uniref:Uncharacterized protein n=1 Tax=Soboliphyme baturini TaxID=241478 RepID=A0A183J3M3_9BILA|nr:unnamed protein product [Soboliphyme baturini]